MLTEWQKSVFDSHRQALEACKGIDELMLASRGFLCSSQTWLTHGLAPIYSSRLKQIKHGVQETLVIIDAMNWIFADWSIDRSPANACKAFGTRLRKIASEFNARWVCVACESQEELDRKKLFPQYKSSRIEHDDGIEQTLNLVKQGCESLGVPCISKPGKEADDVIATMATMAAIRGDKCIICTSDRDSIQLLKNGSVVIFKKGAIYNEDCYRESSGLSPKQFVDYISIVGKDDVPGWHGIGDKTAKELLVRYETFTGIWDNADKLTPGKQKTIDEFAKQYFLSRRLHTLDRWLEIDFNWDATIHLST